MESRRIGGFLFEKFGGIYYRNAMDKLGPQFFIPPIITAFFLISSLTYFVLHLCHSWHTYQKRESPLAHLFDSEKVLEVWIKFSDKKLRFGIEFKSKVLTNTGDY